MFFTVMEPELLRQGFFNTQPDNGHQKARQTLWVGTCEVAKGRTRRYGLS
jgi:hypothetical protein